MRVGVDAGGTFTDFVRIDGRGLVSLKVRSTPDDPSRAILEGLSALASTAGPAATRRGRGRRARRTPSCTARPWPRTPCSNAAVRAWRSWRPPDSKTSSTSAARPALSCTTSSSRPRPRLVEPGTGLRRPRTTRRRRARGRATRSRGGRSNRGDCRGIRGRDRGGVSAAFVRECRPRARGGRAASGGRPHRLHVIRGAARVPGVRALEHDGRQRVRHAARWIGYLGRLAASIGSAVRLTVMQSNGGSISATAAQSEAVRTVLSGPAAGVVGAQAVAAAAGFRRVISFDMGGTSTDVSLIDGADSGGRPTRTWANSRCACRRSTSTRSAPAAGRSPGSTRAARSVWDRGAQAHRPARPATARAWTSRSPTPICCSAAWTRRDFSAGACRSMSPARTRRRRRSRAALSLNEAALAEGVIRVANANMERAIRVVSLARGHDPRDFALVAFGGAGADARVRPGRRARHDDRDRAAPRRRALGVRHARGRRHEGLLGERAPAGVRPAHPGSRSPLPAPSSPRPRRSGDRGIHRRARAL